MLWHAHQRLWMGILFWPRRRANRCATAGECLRPLRPGSSLARDREFRARQKIALVLLSLSRLWRLQYLFSGSAFIGAQSLFPTHLTANVPKMSPSGRGSLGA